MQRWRRFCNYSYKALCRRCLLVHCLLMVMTFAVEFFTVHVGLVVYAFADAVLGRGHPSKGQRKCD